MTSDDYQETWSTEQYQQGLWERIEGRKLSPPPSPWKQILFTIVGGLESIGFDEDSDLLLVTSTSSGRGVFDCATGARVARDYDFTVPSWEETRRLLCPGIGPLAGKMIRMAGLHGGGLPNMTEDGWSLEAFWRNWVSPLVFFIAPQGGRPG